MMMIIIKKNEKIMVLPVVRLMILDEIDYRNNNDIQSNEHDMVIILMIR
jgi:hypothetical protein